MAKSSCVNRVAPSPETLPPRLDISSSTYRRNLQDANDMSTRVRECMWYSPTLLDTNVRSREGRSKVYSCCTTAPTTSVRGAILQATIYDPGSLTRGTVLSGFISCTILIRSGAHFRPGQHVDSNNYRLRPTGTFVECDCCLNIFAAIRRRSLWYR